MKKLSRRTKICSIIFIFLIITALLLIRPVYKKLESTVDKYTMKIIDYVYQNTGIVLSYKSFSPSILASFRINDIACKDENGNLIASVDRLSVDYRLLSLLKGDLTTFVRGVKISGVTVDINRTIDIVQKNIERYSAQETPPEEQSDIDINQILSFIPSSITLDKLTFLYDFEYADIKYYVNNIKLTNSRRKKNIEFTLKSKAEAYIKPVDMTVTGSVGLTGTLYDDLDNSSILINLSDFTDGDFKLSRINLLTTYNNSVIEMHTVQNVFPLSVKAEYDINTMDAYLDVQSDGFEVLQLVSTKNSEIKDYVKGIKVSMNTHGSYHGADEKFDYSSNGTVVLPDRLIPGGLNFTYSLNGDEQAVRLNRIDARSNYGRVTGNLSYKYGTLQVEGVIGAEDIVLPNGKKVNTEIYIDPIYDGFTFFSPQIQIGSKNLTAMQSNVHLLKDSIDFDFEVSDYSRATGENSNGNIGVIKLAGSYLLESNYAQANMSLNSISLGSVMEYVCELVPQDTAADLKDIADFADSYIFTSDVYISSDFNSVSYNVPYILVANVKEGNQYLFASANGNEQSFNLSRFDLILGDFAVNLTGSLDSLPETGDLFFVLDAVASSIPYHFTGSVIDNIISISGDYGLESKIRIGKQGVDGNLKMRNLPIAVQDMSFILSSSVKFTYDSGTGPQVQVDMLEIEKPDVTSSINPKFTLSGNGTKYGAQLTSLSYSDRYSTLEGGGDITININEGIFSSAGVSVSMKNITGDEKIVLDLSLSNPENLPLSGETFMNSIYINSQIQINHFGLSRFTTVKNDNNELTAAINFTGTLEHPSVFVTINKLSMLFNKDLVNISGNMILEDRLVSISDFDFKHTDFKLTDLHGGMDLNTFEGNFSAIFATLGSDKDIEIPLKLKIFDAYFPEPKTFMPDLFSVTLSSDKIGGSLIKKEVAFDVTATYTPDFISIFSSDNLGLVGTYIPQTGELIGSLDSDGLVYVDFNGTIGTEAMDVLFANIDINLKNILSYFDLDDTIKIENGNINGDFYMRGNFDTPEFDGSIYIPSPRFQLPTIFKNVVFTDRIQIDAKENEFTLVKAVYSVKNEKKFIMDGLVSLDKWDVDTVVFNMETIKGVTTPLAFKSPFVNVAGDLNCNISIGYVNDTWNIRGKVQADNLDIVTNVSDITEAAGETDKTDSDSDVYLTTDLEVMLGTHVSLNFNPILRCIFVPNTNITVKIDTLNQFYEVGGELKLKSGDINYLSRNFYIKEGSIKFTQQDMTNPLITIKAETREKDSNGQNVKIIFSVENQYLMDLNPKFYSEPAKSENEILLLLGQVVIADSESFGQMLATAGDYYIQSTLIRDMENKLRDLLNFDIFSLRTNIIQNAIKLSTSENLNQGNITIGNFLDNTTVYIGKYLGSSLYVDAMLHLSMDDKNDISFANGLVFKPEFGLELELPIVNIRWNMAPDINAIIHQQYVPSTSVSLTWKMTF